MLVSVVATALADCSAAVRPRYIIPGPTVADAVRASASCHSSGMQYNPAGADGREGALMIQVEIDKERIGRFCRKHRIRRLADFGGQY